MTCDKFFLEIVNAKWYSKNGISKFQMYGCTLKIKIVNFCNNLMLEHEGEHLMFIHFALASQHFKGNILWKLSSIKSRLSFHEKNSSALKPNLSFST